MSIEKMKRLRLMAVSSQKQELMRELMLLGCVEILEPSAGPDAELAARLSRYDGSALARCRTDHSVLTAGLKQLDRYAPEKKGLLTPRPEAKLADLLDEEGIPASLALAEKLSGLDEQIRRLSMEESRERAVLESLTPWRELTLPLDCRGTETAAALLGTFPAAQSLEDADAALAAASEKAQLLRVSEDKHLHYIVLVCWRAELEDALSALRPLGFSQMNMGELKGTARACMDASEAKLADCAAQKDALAAQIAAEAPRRLELQLRADALSTKIAGGEADARLLRTDSVFLFEGWLPARDEPRLSEVLARYDCAWETEDPDPDKPEEVPIKLRSNRLTNPYNLVTEMYSLPSYSGLDPNPFIMPFFALFFGIMFADMAYGAILLVAGLLITRKARPRGSMKYMAGMLIQCGITTFIMGFLTGSLFGNAIPILGGMFGRTWTVVPYLATLHLGSAEIVLPLDLLSGQNPMYVLIGAMCLGVVHLALGVGLGIYLKIRDGDWFSAIFCDLSWWIIFAGLAVMLLRGSRVLLFVGIGMMVLGAVFTHKGFGRITGILSAVYSGVTGYLGDVLSYSRLMALMLAGSVIASVFNQLGALGGGTVGGVILFIIVFCIGHTLNFALNLIGCFVHTMRLQFLEFFGKWYRDGGRAFRPFTIQNKYVDIMKED